MARILLSLADEKLAERVADSLKDGRHEMVTLTMALDGLKMESIQAAAKAVLETQGDVMILDYWPEDAASVKLMQTVSDLSAMDKPTFIFIESPGREAVREEVLMALNEGVQAFLPADFQPAALSNYVDRAIMGPGRLRPRTRDPLDNDETIKTLEETLGQIRVRSLGFQKIIAHLLATPAISQNRKVLVISDSPYQLEMLKKILEDHTFQVMAVSTPSEGLNMALNENPRIIVSDLELEGQTGLDLCQTIKFTHKLTPCYYIICTASQDKLSKVMVPGNGVDDCLLKPSGPHDNLEFVSRVALGLLL